MSDVIATGKEFRVKSQDVARMEAFSLQCGIPRSTAGAMAARYLISRIFERKNWSLVEDYARSVAWKDPSEMVRVDISPLEVSVLETIRDRLTAVREAKGLPAMRDGLVIGCAFREFMDYVDRRRKDAGARAFIRQRPGGDFELEVLGGPDASREEFADADELLRAIKAKFRFKGEVQSG